MKKLKALFIFVILFSCLFYGAWSIEQKIWIDLSDPLKNLYIISGWASLIFLIIGIFKGKLFGLAALLFALLHLSIFVYFDFYFDWALILKEMMQKHYIYFGLIALILMVILGIWSFFRWFPILRYLVFISLATACIHTIIAQKVITPIYMLLIVVCTLTIFYKLIKSR